MEKIKCFFHKINANMILYSAVLIIILVFIHIVLKFFGLKFREWVYLTITIISITMILIFFIQKFIKKSRKVKLIIISIITIILALCVIFWRIVFLGLFVLLVIINPKTEHVVERDGVKYIASVDSQLTETEVYYYDYINFLVRGTEVKFRESYKGAYDPILREIEEKNIDSEVMDSDEQTNDEEVSSEYILYKKEIDEDCCIRIINLGNVLGGRMLISVQKTDDGGKTWNDLIKNSDGCITVNREAKFNFINENIGFINNLSSFIIGEENDSLLVTVDGGENYESANFKFPTDIQNTTFYIDDLPYLEGNELKVNLVSASDGSDTYYEFTSIDNGLNWTYSK